jgi:hypothetical protein
VYEVTEKCMSRLDKYESSYNRIKITVYDEDGSPVEATAYIKGGQPKDAMPSQEYLSIIQQGYKDWGIL